MPSRLEIDSVVKSFNHRPILTDIYLKCETGEIIGLLGRNGTGKSTFLKILFGTQSADNKFIRIDNRIFQNPYLTKNEICYLPQDNFIPKHLKVEKAVKLYLGKSKADMFLDDPILHSIRDNKTGSVSGGELRYLEIKLLLSTDCKFILLDEPFNGVSPVLIESIKDLIKTKSNTKGIILTDHDYRNVLDIANRYCLLFDGGIKQIKDKNDLVNWGYLVDSMISE